MSRLSSSQRQQAVVFVGLLFGAFGRPGPDLARDRRQVVGDGGPLGQELLKLLAGETFLGATTVTAGPGGTTAAALQLLQVINVILRKEIQEIAKRNCDGEGQCSATDLPDYPTIAPFHQTRSRGRSESVECVWVYDANDGEQAIPNMQHD